jgi:hypothetical protein
MALEADTEAAVEVSQSSSSDRPQIRVSSAIDRPEDYPVDGHGEGGKTQTPSLRSPNLNFRRLV